MLIVPRGSRASVDYLAFLQPNLQTFSESMVHRVSGVTDRLGALRNSVKLGPHLICTSNNTKDLRLENL